MKEKDLDKCLDNLIIKGLIREAEQDNADFEVAMRKISDEDFLAMTYDTADESVAKTTMSGNKGWKIWVAAIASVAAILLIVFIPAYREMNSRLCESALLISEAYVGLSRGVDISSMQNDEVDAMLPELEKQYDISVKQSMKLHREQSMAIAGEQSVDMDDIKYYISPVSLRDAGMELLQAYLKLNQKEKAIETIRELAEAVDDPEFKDYCRKMLEILE